MQSTRIRRHGHRVALGGLTCLLVFAAACGGDGGGSSATDGGPDGGDGLRDAGPGGGGPPDAGPGGGDGSMPDGGDVPIDRCGNGVVDTGEQCDGEAFGGDSCIARDFTSGQLRCSDACEVSEARCDLCGDGVCGMSESATGCTAECAAVGVAAGYSHTCAVRADGSVWCWGARAGHRAGGMGDVIVPHPIAGIADAAGVAVGEAHTCVRLADGGVVCWGRNGFGELGNGETGRETGVAQVVTLPQAAIQLSAGRHHTCAVLDDGRVYCWGRGDHGEMGDGRFDLRNPTPVDTGLSGMSFATSGEFHSCAANQSDAYCWGWNEQGQLGTADSTWHPEPTRVAANVRALGSGNRHTCAYILNVAAPPQFSGLFCWGSNGYGQLGAAPSPDALGPQRIFAGFTEVEGGATFTCGLAGIEPAAVDCWGRNDFGQLGDGTQDLRYAPAAVLGIANAVEITGGEDHACVLLDDGQLRCWGRNLDGQVGSAAPMAFHAEPTAPEGFQ